MRKLKTYFIFIFIIQIIHIQNGKSQGTWVWIHGDSVGTPMSGTGTEAIYGVQGVPNAANTPGARYQGASCLDNDGNLWFYSGQPVYTGTSSLSNDLWKYNITTNMWTWMKGPQFETSLAFVSGTLGVPDINNHPGKCVVGGMMTCDRHNNLWLFTDENNMFWRYNIATNTWTWMHGIPGMFVFPVYGTLGISDPANMPALLDEGKTLFADPNKDTIWLVDNLKDVWVYSIATNEFTWIHGNHGTFSHYGTKGVESPDNFVTPTTEAHSAWMDDQYIYLLAYNSSTWRYNKSTNMWAWIAGDDTLDFTPAIASYNTDYCDFNLNNTMPEVWETRGCNNSNSKFLWMYGGFAGDGLWVFDKKKVEWLWIEGGNHSTRPSHHGTKGVPDPLNFPTLCGGGQAQWIDSCGNVWYFAGLSNEVVHRYNTIWKYIPDYDCIKEDPPIFDYHVDDTVLCAGDYVTINVPINFPFTINPTMNVHVSGHQIQIQASLSDIEYTIGLSTKMNCQQFDSTIAFHIKGFDCDTMFFSLPNVFSPNGDQLNDVFHILSKDIQLKTFYIYNRWGQRVFSTVDINKGWDGNFLGKPCELGVYFYMIEFRMNGKDQLKKGDVTLLR